MNSIFDDEEELLFPRSRVLLSPTMAEAPGVTSVLVPSLPTQPVPSPPGTRRRTVSEAMERASIYISGSRVLQRVPMLKPYAMIFQAATYAFIAVDPLDRLEGGLID